MCKKNEYFDAMWAQVKDVAEKLDEWNKLRDKMVEFGATEEMLEKLNAEQPQYDFKQGEYDAMMEWRRSNNSEKIMRVNHAVFADEIDDFVNALRNAGVRRFVLDKSEATFPMIETFVDAGCKLRGIKALHEEGAEIKGLLFLVGKKGEPDEVEDVEAEPVVEPKEEVKKARRGSKKASA